MPNRESVTKIPLPEFNCRALRLWGDDNLLLAAGSVPSGEYNAMTVGWGFFGTLWAKPAAMVMLRPDRYTLEFIDRYSDFTLSALPEERRDALAFLGSHSGRDMADKITRAGLTAVPAEGCDAPAFAEAELTLECRKMYRFQLNGRGFIDKSPIEKYYSDRDYHLCFFAEVTAVFGTAGYRSAK